MPLSSVDVLDDRVESLKALIPEAFVEGRLDVEKLRAALGHRAEDARERYGLSWAGKAEAMRTIQVPSVGTLLPLREESVNFDESENVFIEGDNLEVLKLLQKSYYGKVKLIYIDPPYNTGNEFIYPDNFREGLQDYLKYSGQVDAEGLKLSTNTETSGRFHSKWLSMIWPRVFLARNLLRDDGVMLISIDDHEAHNLRAVVSEIFGEENIVATFVWQKKYSRDNRPVIGTVHEYLLMVARDAEAFARVRNLLPPSEESTRVYRNPNNDPRGRWRPVPMTAQAGHATANQFYKITSPAGVVHEPPEGRCWSPVEETFEQLRREGRIWFGKDGAGQPNVIRYLSEIEGFVPWTWLPSSEVGHTDEAKKEL
jgi:adenine-specific DNA-methyltransferase